MFYIQKAIEQITAEDTLLVKNENRNPMAKRLVCKSES